VTVILFTFFGLPRILEDVFSSSIVIMSFGVSATISITVPIA